MLQTIHYKSLNQEIMPRSVSFLNLNCQESKDPAFRQKHPEAV